MNPVFADDPDLAAEPQEKSGHRRVHVSAAGLAIAGAAVAALAVRWFWLDRQAWYIDETLDLNTTELSVSEIIREGDGFPPLGILMTKAFAAVFGWENARYVALLSGMLAWAAIVDTARRVTDMKGAVWAAWVAAIAPTLILFSQEIRPHSIALGVSAVAVWALVVLLESPTPGRAALLGVVLSLGISTQYYFAALGVGIVAIVAWRCRPWRSTIRSLWPVAVLPMVTALLLVPSVGGDVGSQSDQSGHALGLPEVGYTLLGNFSGYTLGPSLIELRSLSAKDALVEVLPWALAVGGVLLIAAISLYRARNRHVNDLVWLLGITITVTLAMIAISGSGLRVRYLALPVPVVVLLVAIGLRLAPRSLAVLGAVLYFAASSIAVYNRNYVDEHRVPAMDEALTYIAESDHPDALVAIQYGIQIEVAERHSETANLHFVGWRIEDRETAEAKIAESDELADGEGYWVMYLLPHLGDPNGEYLEAVEDRGATWVAEFPHVELYWVPTGQSG
jgi:hypothetical protein